MKSGKGGRVLSSDLARHAGLGLHFGATLLVFGALGYGLDRWLGTEPWLLVAGVFAGFVGGTISMVRRVFPARGRAAGGTRRNDPPHDEHRPA
jgi:F0F1-type ATP synthase assembly protein I